MNTLGAVFRALEAAGIGLDVESARDAAWLSARLLESQSDAAARAAPPPANDATPPGEPSSKETTTAPPDGVQTTPDPTRMRTRADRVTAHGLLATEFSRVRLPLAAGLAGERGIPGVLRPLRRKVRSPAGPIDEAATVRRATEDDMWMPIRGQVAERWLELALVVDGALSMAVWRDTVRALRRVLVSAAAFRDVRVWHLETEGDAVGMRPSSARGSSESASLTRKCPFGGGRRGLVIVITDCVSAGWYDGRVLSVLARWSADAPVALLQVLPERMWARTALGEAIAVKLHATTIAAPNGHLHWVAELPVPEAGWKSRNQGVPSGLCLFPVVTAEPRSLRRLARMVAGTGGDSVTGALFETGAVAEPRPAEPPTAPVDRVRRFWSVSSSAAAELASLLSAAPVQSSGMLRLLRRELMPAADAGAEAEVLLSGLLTTPKETDTRDEDLPLEFIPEVRQILLENAPVERVLEVLRRVAAFVEIPGIARQTFESWLLDPSSGEEQLKADTPLTKQMAAVLEQIGGAYTRVVHPKSRRALIAPAAAEPNIASNAAEAPSTPEPNVEEGLTAIENMWHGLTNLAEELPPTFAAGREPKFLVRLSRPPRFVGRADDLRHLHAWWQANDEKRALALVGPAGIGKTALAAAWLDQILAEPRSGGTFVASLAWHIEEVLARAVTYFGHQSPPGSSSSDRLASLRDSLSDGGSHLLVLDDFDGRGDEHLVERLDLVAMAARLPKVKVLLVLREAPPPDAFVMTLAGLNAEDATEFIRAEYLRTGGVMGSPAETIGLVGRTRGNPAMIGMLVTALVSRQISLAWLYAHYAPSSLQDLVEMLKSSPGPDLPARLDELTQRYDAGHAPPIDAVVAEAREEMTSERWFGPGLAFSLGRLLARARRLPEAIDALEQALSVSHRLGDKASVARARRELAGALEMSNHLDRARSEYASALEEFRALGDKTLEATTTVDLGRLAALEGDHDLARKYLYRAREQFEILGQPRQVATTCGLLGQIARDTRRFEEALSLYAAARAAAQEEHDGHLAAQLTRAEATVHVQMGDTEGARRMLEEAKQFFEKFDDPRQLAGTMNELAHLLVQLGDLSGARHHLELVVSTYEKLGESDLAQSAAKERDSLGRSQETRQA